MARYIPQADQDYLLGRVQASDIQVFCSAQPLRFYHGVHAQLWLAATVYAQNDIVRPPTANGKVYECTVGGTSGGTEPGWGTIEDGIFSDGTVTWKVHNNYAIANTNRVPGDYTIEAYSDVPNSITGRALVIPEKVGVVSHTTGIVSHCAFLCSSDRSVRLVTLAQTTVGGNEVESGRTTIFYAMKYVVRDPILLP